ncbi:MAG TPA: CHAD domain-containing protein [Solirubrobacterales bacterium]|nr:CHAD domain-containing protein [Solirubrobacterales bacterium]
MPSEVDRSYELKGSEELGAGLKRVAATRAEKALERLRGNGEDPAEAIHGARKDMKKLRAVLRMARGSLPQRLYKEENRRYRDAAQALSASRDAEVKLKTLDALGERDGGLPREAIETWRQILDRDREAAVNTAHAEAAIGLIEEGLRGIQSWPLEGDSWKLVGGEVKRAYRRGHRAMAIAAADQSEESFHDWRKRAKDLWYQLRLLGPAWSGPLGAAAEEAHRLTNLLGDHHDLAVLRQDLGERQLGEEETQALEAAIDARQAQLAVEAFALGRRLYAEPPKAYGRRLRRYWQAWRG